jgi:hypothetical protein
MTHFGWDMAKRSQGGGVVRLQTAIFGGKRFGAALGYFSGQKQVQIFLGSTYGKYL